MTFATAGSPDAHRSARRPGLVRLLACLPVAAVIGASALPAHAGLTFTTTFANTVNATQQAAIAAGLAEYGTLFQDNVNVSLYFKNTGNGLGTSSTFSFGVDYKTYYDALVLDGSSAADATALTRLLVDGTGVNNPVNGTGTIKQGRAGFAAVGINIDTTGLDTGAGDGL